MAFVEEHRQQVFPHQAQDQQRNADDDFHLQHVFIGDAEDIAEDDRLYVDRGLSDTISRPTAKKVEKIKPMMASSRSRVMWRTSRQRRQHAGEEGAGGVGQAEGRRRYAGHH